MSIGHHEGPRKEPRVFKDRHHGQSCGILANGPSLADNDLSRITYATIGINRSWLLKESEYHCLVDSINFDILREAGRRLRTVFCGGGREPHWRDLADEVVELKGLNKMVEGKNELGWSWDIEEGVFFRSATYIALQVAVYMGFGKDDGTIYLLGVDLKPRGTIGHFFPGHPMAAGMLGSQTEAFTIAARELERKVRVVNLNPDSALRVFPFARFDEVFSG